MNILAYQRPRSRGPHRNRGGS